MCCSDKVKIELSAFSVFVVFKEQRSAHNIKTIRILAGALRMSSGYTHEVVYNIHIPTLSPRETHDAFAEHVWWGGGNVS